MKSIRLFFPIVVFFVLIVPAGAAQLLVGAARIDITPPKSVPLRGQHYQRISEAVDTPLTANVTALESRDGDKSLDSVIFISADIISIPLVLENKVKAKVAKLDSSIDVNKLVLNGTHTHTAPILAVSGPKVPDSADVMPYPEILEFVADRIAQVAVEGWKNRKPGKMAWGLDFAAVGFDRRSVYADGRSVMYGKTNDPNFRGVEHMEDHDVGVLFFRDAADKLLSVIINIACPSQVVEHLSRVNADYWHPIREKMAARFGDDVVVLGWCAAAGGTSPRIRYRAAAVKRMNELRNLNDMQEIARKVDRAVGDAWEVGRKVWYSDVPLMHRVETLQLPMWKISDKEYETAKTELKAIENRIKAGGSAQLKADVGRRDWFERSIKRYEAQQKGKELEYETTIHVIRLGEVAVCTNQFELFSDFGVQMKAKSPAVMTFVIQLVGAGSYVPTERAAKGGGYGAVVQSCPVGAEGGQALTDRTLEILKELYKEQ